MSFDDQFFLAFLFVFITFLTNVPHHLLVSRTARTKNMIGSESACGVHAKAPSVNYTLFIFNYTRKSNIGMINTIAGLAKFCFL